MLRVNGDIPKSPIAEWVKFISALLIIPVLGFVFTKIWTHEARLTTIEASRFTSSDGLVMWRAIDEKANKADVPPAEVRTALSRLDADMRTLRIKLDAFILSHAKEASEP